MVAEGADRDGEGVTGAIELDRRPTLLPTVRGDEDEIDAASRGAGAHARATR